MKVPDGDVPVGAAGEANLRVGTDGQSVTGGRRRGQLRLDTRGGRGQIPDGQGARLAPDDEGPPVGEQPTGADVVVSVLIGQEASLARLTTRAGPAGGPARRTHEAVQLGHGRLVARMADVPHFNAALAAGVDVARGVTDGDGAHHLPVAQSIDLASVARDAWADQRVRRERHGLHLSVGTHMKGIGSGKGRNGGVMRRERRDEAK